MATLTVPTTLNSRVQLAVTARGLISECFSLGQVTAGTTIATQVIFGGLIGLRAGDVVTNICVCTTTVAVGTAPTTIKLGLTSTAGVVLATTGNVNTLAGNWDATGPHAYALSSAYTVTADGGYYAVFLQDGAFSGTALQIARLNVVSGVDKALGSGALAAVNTSSGKTDITGTLVLVDPGSGTNYWFGVS